MNVVEILNSQEPILNKPKKKVCAYARVSSKKELQKTSFDLQIKTYTDLILDNPDWDFVGVFSDYGKSGTNTNNRTQFNLMLDLANAGGIDLILTKSLSRFARNTVDTLNTIRKLRDINVEVFFEKENLSSFDPKVEFVISVLAGMAEEESRTISQNVKWGVNKRFKKGIVPMVTSMVLGYDRDKFSNIIINESEAKIVRKIYSLYINGYSFRKIADYLNNKGLVTKFKKINWYPSAVQSILTNERYAGNALLQKSIRTNIGKKYRIKNQDIAPKYFVKNSHPAIVSQETWDKVQSILNTKRLKYNHTLDKAKLKQIATNKSIYTNFIKCGVCGNNYQFKINNINTKYASKILICNKNREKKLCPNDSLFVSTFDKILITHINYIIKNKAYFINTLRKAFKNHPAIISLNKDISQTQEKLNKLTAKLKTIILLNDEAHLVLKNEINSTIRDNQINLVKYKNQLLTSLNIDNKINYYISLLKPFNSPINSLDDFPFKKLFDSTIIYNRNNISFNIYLDLNIKKEVIYTFNSINTDYLIRKTKHSALSYISIY